MIITEKIILKIGIEELEPVITYEIQRSNGEISYINKQITLLNLDKYSDISDKIIITSEGDIIVPEQIADREISTFLDNIYEGGSQDNMVRKLFFEEQTAFKTLVLGRFNDQNATEVYTKFCEYVNSR